MIYHGVPHTVDFAEWVSLNIPFEYQDFMLPDVLDCKREINRRVEIYLSVDRDRGNDIVHGPFLDIAVHSSDKEIRKISDYRIRQACDIAVALKAKAIILHTNLIPNFYLSSYRQGWIERNEEYIHSLLADYPTLCVYMENMFDNEPDCLCALAQQMSGERFGICLDIAHANISKTEISEWIKACAPYTKHYHLNDNQGAVDEHLPIGEGNIPWKKIIHALNKKASCLIEVDSLEKYKQSKEALKAMSIQRK